MVRIIFLLYTTTEVFIVVPVQVSDVSVVNIDSTSMKVTWMPPHANTYSVITSYIVKYEAHCQDVTLANSTFIRSDAEREAILDNLEEGLSYTVTVTAANVLGESRAIQIVKDTDSICKLYKLMQVNLFL